MDLISEGYFDGHDVLFADSRNKLTYSHETARFLIVGYNCFAQENRREPIDIGAIERSPGHKVDFFLKEWVTRLIFTIKYPLLAAMLEPKRRKLLPRVTIEQRVKFAILCAKAVYKDEAFNLWADRWLSAEDRSLEAAELAVAGTGDAGLTYAMMCNPEVMKRKAAAGSAGSAAHTPIWAAEGGTWVVGASAAETAMLAANAGLSVESGKRLAEQAVAHPPAWSKLSKY